MYIHSYYRNELLTLLQIMNDKIVLIFGEQRIFFVVLENVSCLEKSNVAVEATSSSKTGKEIYI